MFEIHLLFDEVFLSLNVNFPNKNAKLVIRGDRQKVKRVKELLDGAYGAFGHIFNAEYTNPIDLHYAVMTTLDGEFTPMVSKGKKLIKKYDPEIPDGAIT